MFNAFPDPSLAFLRNGFYLNFINVVFFSSISSLITPLFIYVSKKNRFKDQQTLGFPIALQIYNTTLTMLCLQSIIIISIPALIILSHFDNPLVIILIAIITISYHFIDVLIQIQLVLLILLASQRLLLFFIPGTEKIINFSKVSINRFVIFLFITINVKDLIFQLCLTILENSDWAPFKVGRFEVGETDLFKFRLSSYLLLNSLLLFSSILYIPMFISIWKMRHLRSVALFQPQKYVFYQIGSILLAKLFPALCFKLLGYFFLTDCSVSPFMIQLTYLLCNKRNVDTLLSSPVGRAMKFIFCHNRRLYQVEPSVWATSNQTVKMKRLKTNANSSFNTMNESIDWTNWRENFPLLLTTFNFFSIPLFSFLSASVSPFYIYVNKKNQLTDRKSVIFPVAVHSYGLLVKLIWLEYASALALSAATCFYLQKITQLLAIFFLITMSSFLAQDVLIQVQHILLFVQASQRFLLYFIPKLENHLNFSLITTKRFVYILCILITLKDTVLFVLLCKLIASDDRKLDNDYFVLLFRKSFYLLLNTLLFIVCILYIPMFISIWRLRHLRSVALFRPQKYVFYQVLSIVSAKIVTTLLLGAHLAAAWIYLKMHSIEYPEALLFFQEKSFDIVTYYFFYDCSLIPLVIQLTYLFCNKRNVDTLLSSPVGKAAKFVFCHNRGLSQVKPGVWTTNNQTV